MSPISYDMAVQSQVESKTKLVRYKGTTWTYPGNLEHHLKTVHKIDTKNFSQKQRIIVHDNIHNTRGKTGIFVDEKELIVNPG